MLQLMLILHLTKTKSDSNLFGMNIPLLLNMTCSAEELAAGTATLRSLCRATVNM